MDRTWWTKLVLLISISLGAAYYVTPTVMNLDLEKTKFPLKKKVTLGLDLQGGLYMVYGIDFAKVYREVLDRQAASLREAMGTKQIPVTVVRIEAKAGEETDPHVDLKFDAAKRETVYGEIKEKFTTLRLVEEAPGTLRVGIARTYRDEIKSNTLGQSIEVIRNRIDEFGVAEPAISSQGDNRIVVELPGVKEVDRAKQLVGRTAKLEFKIANDKNLGPQQVFELIASIEKDKGLKYKDGDRFSDYVGKLNEFAKGKIPADSEIAFERGDATQVQQGAASPGDAGLSHRIPYLLYTKADVTGKDLQDAQVSFDQESRRPIVTFQLTPSGATLFEKLTTDHKGQRLAIVLDGIVHSAPVIQSTISDRGQITLGRGDGDQLMKEAKDLAIVLRAGALPAQLELLEQRVIGPTLGQDSIRKGVTAALVGCALVFVFMVFYYRMSGAVAVLSLVLNGLFVLATLIGMDATLTLPGIAGLALVIGMAVDSNVIIFERIRDELEEGKAPAAAIQAGFDKAFSSIFDANITHGIVGMILLNFGTGPIRGFAVTLLIGIATTLFTAVTVCKLIFDGYVSVKRGQIEKLSI